MNRAYILVFGSHEMRTVYGDDRYARRLAKIYRRPATDSAGIYPCANNALIERFDLEPEPIAAAVRIRYPELDYSRIVATAEALAEVTKSLLDLRLEPSYLREHAPSFGAWVIAFGIPSTDVVQTDEEKDAENAAEVQRIYAMSLPELEEYIEGVRLEIGRLGPLTEDQRHLQGHVIMWGSDGYGAALWAARTVLERGGTAAMRRVREVATLSAFDAGAVELRMLKGVELLVLEDPGTEQQTGWGSSVLFELLDARYQGQRKTVITSNLNPKEDLKERLGGRVWDRCDESGRVVMLKGKSMRGAA